MNPRDWWPFEHDAELPHKLAAGFYITVAAVAGWFNDVRQGTQRLTLTDFLLNLFTGPVAGLATFYIAKSSGLIEWQCWLAAFAAAAENKYFFRALAAFVEHIQEFAKSKTKV